MMKMSPAEVQAALGCSAICVVLGLLACTSSPGSEREAGDADTTPSAAQPPVPAAEDERAPTPPSAGAARSSAAPPATTEEPGARELGTDVAEPGSGTGESGSGTDADETPKPQREVVRRRCKPGFTPCYGGRECCNDLLEVCGNDNHCHPLE